MSDSPCCAPTVARLGELVAVPISGQSGQGHHAVEQCVIPAQIFLMGDSHGDGFRGDGERPVHDVFVDAFSIDATAMSNGDFQQFIAATGYETEAERFGSSAVFRGFVDSQVEAASNPVASAPWWLTVEGSDWQHPRGPGSDISDLADHPAVHISWNDATAYCDWSDRRLPTEAEWELAARGGLSAMRYPWGDKFEYEKCNIWIGEFPDADPGVNNGTMPVKSFNPNGFGLWQPVGNVWEWCSDFYNPGYYGWSPTSNPTGPERGATRVLRGGSYLCHDSYCNRYRNAARTSNTPDSSMGNAGFRTVAKGL